MPIVRTTGGRSFDASEGESLLEAALRANITLPYSCKTGRCGTCKGHVHSGSTIAMHDESGLSSVERTTGWILTCVRSVQTDVEIAVDDLSDLKIFPAKTLPCRIQAMDRLSRSVVKVLLRLPPASNFEFFAGQYIDVIGHGGPRRSYSIANAPSSEKTIELHIGRVPGGVMSEYWFEESKINDLLRLSGPLGTFFLRDIEGLDVVFLATGTGIAPIKAMLENIAAYPPPLRPRSIALFWGGRMLEDIYWDPNTVALDYRFVPVLSRPDVGWNGARGYVQQAFLATAAEFDRTVVYACGLEAMIHDARKQLIECGLNERCFFSDAFVCSAST